MSNQVPPKRHWSKWKFDPPPGVRFVNEFGSSVTIDFPTDMLDQVYMSLFQQLQTWRDSTLKMEEMRKQKEGGKLESLPQQQQLPPTGGESLTITVTPIKKEG